MSDTSRERFDVGRKLEVICEESTDFNTRQDLVMCISEFYRIGCEINSYRTIVEASQARIAELEADNAKLREALKRFVDDAINVDVGGGDYVGTTCESLEIAKKALSTAPTTSLDNFRNEVIDECALLAKSMHSGWVTSEVHDAILKLKHSKE